MMPKPPGKRARVDHIPCMCGHMGWRHRDDGTCARCECQLYQQPPLPEHPSGTREPRRTTQKLPHRAA
jgi:hypothetical protein